MDSTRKLLLISGLAAAGLIGIGIYNAKAADLGGNCCADLEERLADLEATTVHKGNRKVSLTLSGYVTHNVMFWDDGTQKDMYVGDGGAVSSRFRFTGTSKISADLSAGFIYEFGMQNNQLGKMNQLNHGDDLGGNMEIRQSVAYLESKTLGKVKIGHGSTATDDLILIDVSNASVVSTADVGLFNNGFFIRSKGVLTPLTWADAFNGRVSFDTVRRNHVLYETPSLLGFTVQAAVGENNFWDIALRYAGEMAGFRVAGGFGYSLDNEQPTFGPLGITANKLKDLKGSVSAMHMETGLFATVAAGRRQIDWNPSFSVPLFSISASAKDATFWHVTGGWQKNVFGFGATTIFAEYQQAKDMLGYNVAGSFFGTPFGLTTSSDATYWGAGVVQKLDAAAMELYVAYKNYGADASLSAFAGKSTVSGSASADQFQTVIVGTRISF